MRRLAQELRVTTMAVYHHFESKAEVMQAAADQVWIEVVLSVEPHDDPVETILQGFLTARRVFRAHRDITPYAVASPRTPDAVHAMASAIAARNRRRVDRTACAVPHGRCWIRMRLPAGSRTAQSRKP